MKTQALFLDEWGREINFTYFSLRMFLFDFLLLASMSYDQVGLGRIDVLNSLDKVLLSITQC